MTQTEQIKAEIESLYAKTSIGLNEYTAGYENGKAEVCGLLLGFINSLQAEPVSENLELASERYACKFSSSKYGHDKIKKAYTAGAQWQEEQMLAKAVDGEVHKMGNIAYIKETSQDAIQGALKDFADRDKVKLIIIKED